MNAFPALPAALAAALLSATALPALAASARSEPLPDRGVTTTPTPGFVQDPPTSPTPPAPPQPPDMRAGPPTEPSPLPEHHPAAMTVLDASSLSWSAAPPVLPRGAQVAILAGDPFAPGPFVLRLKMPPGYTIPPHWHRRAENLTVISGVLSLGMGDTLDPGVAQTLAAGGFHTIPAGQRHFAFSQGGAVVQLHGEGPFDITYVNPRDNPEPGVKPR